MAARWVNKLRLFYPQSAVISTCTRLLQKTIPYEKCRVISNHSLYSGSLGNGVLYRRKISTSPTLSLMDTDAGIDQPIDFKSISSLIKESLSNRGHGLEVIQGQLEVLDSLTEFKEGKEKIEAVRKVAEKLPHTHVYELAATLFGLSGVAGEDALGMSVPLFWLASLAGNTDAKYSYAKLLQTGQGVDPDPIEAGKIFKELAEMGHPFAQFSLAQMYSSGVGVEQDFKLALNLYEISGKNGILPAYTFLGNMYRTGEGVEEDQAKAIELYSQGAEKGDPSAQMALAYCYSHAQGVSLDQEKSFYYHKQAAGKGHPTAQYNVGVHYFAGRGVQLDMKVAAEYFHSAAKQGFELAQINLGNMYYNGLGVEKDLEKAKELYEQAAKTNPNAKLLLEELESEMNKTEDKKDD